MRKNFLFSATAAVLLPAAILLSFLLFVYEERQIVYKAGMIYSKCGLSAIRGKDCGGIYHMIVGNTGDREETVRLFWPADLSAWGNAEVNILNITADRPRSHDPTWNCRKTDKEHVCAIENFAPGTLVIMEMECYACNRQDLGRLEETSVAVQTGAKTFHGDPRLITLIWRMQNVLNLIL